MMMIPGRSAISMKEGEITRYEYPEPGTTVSIDPMGGRTQTTRDPDGRIIERRDASGRCWTVTREELPGGLRGDHQHALGKPAG
jgi:YD repeat-containing protein